MNKTPQMTSEHARSRGLSILEAMILMVIMSIVACGVGVGLQSVAHVPDGTDARLATHMRLVEKMEQLSTYSFATLAANTGLSDTVVIQGQSTPRGVSVITADANGDSIRDSDFIEITVTINNQSLKTRMAQP